MAKYRVSDSVHRTTVEASNMLVALSKAHKLLKGNVVMELFGGESFVADTTHGGTWKIPQSEFDHAWNGATDL